MKRGRAGVQRGVEGADRAGRGWGGRELGLEGGKEAPV